MACKNMKIVDEILPQLKADLEKTLVEYEKAAKMRAIKMTRETEQIKTYVELLESKSEEVTFNGRSLRRLNKLLAWQKKSRRKDLAHRKQQDRLEDHFQELQKVLVGMLSKRFKY
jgi:hypothetical protein